MPGRSTFVRTTAAIAAVVVPPRCPDGTAHHWRVDAMWDNDADAALGRVRQRCLTCAVVKYVPRYHEEIWSHSLPAATTKRPGAFALPEDDEEARILAQHMGPAPVKRGRTS